MIDRARGRGAGSAVLRPTRVVEDVSSLPTVVFGSRDNAWWGTVAFMVVESVTLSAAVVTYFYLMRNVDAWPPLRTPLPDLGVPTAGLVVLLLGLFPMHRFERAAKKLDARGVKLWLWVSVGVTVAATVLRFLELDSLNVRWDANAYGSVAWTIVIAHFTLLIVDVFETGTLAMIFTLAKQEEKHFSEVSDNAFYSYFMTIMWIPLYVIVYLVPRWV